MGKKEIVLVALGGNALQQSGEKGTFDEQRAHVKETAHHLVEILEKGFSLLVTHGNGPQVGTILLQNELSESQIPPMPLDVCVAQTQGMVGYMIQQQLYSHLLSKGKKIGIITLCTQTLVDHKDPAFQNPSKPIGLFYSQEKAESLKKERGWHVVEQIGKGFRRVVPSPRPVDIIESRLIKKLLDDDVIVIACGGGGIPVVQKENGKLKGVEAVVDKDRTAAVLGRKVGAGILLILTDVEQVAINFGQANQKNLDHLTVEEARKYLQQGEFGDGSMGPKVEAACSFVESGGERALITSLKKAEDALKGRAGTLISGKE